MFHKRLMKEFKENRKYVAGIVLTQWIMLLANICFVFATAKLLNGVRLGNTGRESFAGYLILMIAVIATRVMLTKLNGRFSYQASANLKNRLRILLYEKMIRLGPDYYEKYSTSEVVQLSTEGVEQLEIYFSKYVPQFFYAFLAPVTLFFVVGTMYMPVAITLLLCVPLIPGAIMGVQKFARKLLGKYWGAYTELGDHFLEYIQGLTTMKIYDADGYYAKKMHEESEQFRKVTMRVLIMQLNSITVMDLIAYGGAAVGIILGLTGMHSGDLDFGNGVFILLISAEFFLPMRLLGSFFHISMNGNAAADKIFCILDLPETEQGCVTEITNTGISFSDVCFAYSDAKERKVLQDICFEVKPHQLVAIVGESGCGKSTMASLLMGEQPGYDGEILIGSYPLREINSQIRYRKITRIDHNSYLFAGTVRENLQMGAASADEGSMEEALRKARLYEFVCENGGLDMRIQERAENLSGGQKQRLALARAILHDSDIYIFDEATSNIDAESEELILQTIRQLAKEKTVILISHRLANVIVADRIFVLEQGRMTEQGTHEDLLQKRDGHYRKLYESQRELEAYAAAGMTKADERKVVR